MPVTDHFQRLRLDEITVRRDKRQRREIKTEDLERSIRRIGVLQPIIVQREGAEIVLKAGERRLSACVALGLPDIPVRFADELSPVESQIIELEENLKREDLGWRDLVEATARIHGLYRQLDIEWTMTETAEAISLSLGTVSMYLRVHAELANPRVGDASTVREAYNVIARQDSRAAGAALEELLDLPSEVMTELPISEPLAAIPEFDTTGLQTVSFVPGATPLIVVSPSPSRTMVPQQWPKAPEGVLCASFLNWLPAYTGPKFNFLHCDFPYGVGVFHGNRQFSSGDMDAYDDSPEVYFTLLEALCKNLDRIMSVSAHLMFWYSEKHGPRTRETFAKMAPSLEFSQFPLVWVKSDNAGIAAQVNRSPRHVYETALFASRSKRQLVRVMSDAYSAPTDKRLHPACKPEPMLRHFFSMIVDGNTTLLDPTCGSGAALRAAESLGAVQAFGIESDEGHAELARDANRKARMLRIAGSELK